MAYQQLAQGLEVLESELKAFLGPNPFCLLGVDVIPVHGEAGLKQLRPGHDGCYVAVSRGRRHSRVSFELLLDLPAWGRAETIALRGYFADSKLPTGHYERWYESPHAHPYMLDIFDRVDRMAAYALRLLEKEVRKVVQDQNLQLLAQLNNGEVYAVVDYFRVPVQIDYLD